MVSGLYSPKIFSMFQILIRCKMLSYKKGVRGIGKKSGKLRVPSIRKNVKTYIGLNTISVEN